MLSIGLTCCYQLINAGELESFKVGKSRKITVQSIEAYVNRMKEAYRQGGKSKVQPSSADHQKVAVP
jgi:hypothetical protein